MVLLEFRFIGNIQRFPFDRRKVQISGVKSNGKAFSGKTLSNICMGMKDIVEYLDGNALRACPFFPENSEGTKISVTVPVSRIIQSDQSTVSSE